MELRGVDRARRKLRNVATGAPNVFREGLQELGQQARRIYREEEPYRTGALRTGTTYRTTIQGDLYRLRLDSTAKHTDWVMHGRGPVVAIRAKALRFEPGPPGSGVIFRKRVGPAKANPFHQRALQRFEPLVDRAVVAMGARIETMWSAL